MEKAGFYHATRPAVYRKIKTFWASAQSLALGRCSVSYVPSGAQQEGGRGHFCAGGPGPRSLASTGRVPTSSTYKNGASCTCCYQELSMCWALKNGWSPQEPRPRMADVEGSVGSPHTPCPEPRPAASVIGPSQRPCAKAGCRFPFGPEDTEAQRSEAMCPGPHSWE